MSASKQPSDPGSGGGNRLFLLAIGALVVIGLAVIAIVASNQGDDDTAAATDESGQTESGSEPDETGADEAEPQTPASDGAETATITIGGTALPPMPEGVQLADANNDPAWGAAAPTLTGTGFDGSEVVIENDGRPKAIYFVAHWCPHCQAEIPLIQGLIDDGKLPADLDVYAVSTAVERGRGNYPPSEWLEDEGFTPTVIRDDDAASALVAFGASSFPFGVYLDENNEVVARTAGSVDAATLENLWGAAVTAP